MDISNTRIALHNKDHEQIERKASMATTITTASRPIMATRKTKCNEMHNNNNKRKSKTNLHRKQHHQHHHCKHSRNNKIDIIKAVAVDDNVVPEKSKKSKEGIWVSSCCLIQWAGSSKQDPI
ncbi:telomere binding protein [Mucor velutinosus]|uniref:Telomere binding protein n=1 Tax=Mucor velutinosus TaxID=708070 RepID=A0AAN7D4W3_9FUNG|nr:telomere binding protein [Mucor velutinosus]